MNASSFGSLAVMGGGVMAESIVRGGIAAGVLAASDLIVCEPLPERRAIFGAMGVRTTALHHEAAPPNWPLLVAVKPQSFAELARQLRPHLGDQSRLIISILAGTTSSTILAGLGAANRIVRVMPNTAARVGLSASVIASGPNSNVDDLQRVELLFTAIGSTVRIDEAMMDAATAVVGSGPAYVYLLAQAMIEGARAVGFDPVTADLLVRQTIRGAAGMLSERESPAPEVLRSRVTSKGGTTAAAIDVLERSGMPGAIRQAVVAARDRAAELAQIDTDRPSHR